MLLIGNMSVYLIGNMSVYFVICSVMIKGNGTEPCQIKCKEDFDSLTM